MELYHLAKADVDYGQTFEMILAADNEAAARLTAGRYAKECGNPDQAFEWIDDDVTTVTYLGASVDIEPGVIMTKESAS
jgi:hypothetical protein